MEKSVKNAFIYIFQDKDWIKKTSILAVFFFFLYAFLFKEISLLPLLLQHNKEANLTQQALRIVSPILTLISFFATGYISKCTQNVINNTQENILLPDWEDDFFNYFVIAAKRIGSRLGVYILLLPTILLLGIPFIIFWFLSLPLGKIFCSEFKFESYFKWKEAYELIKNNIGLYISILLILINLNLLITLLTVILLCLKVSNNLCSIILAMVSTYTTLVAAYLIGIVGNKKSSES